MKRYLLALLAIALTASGGRVMAQTRTSSLSDIRKECEKKDPNPVVVVTYGDYHRNGYNKPDGYVRKNPEEALRWYRRAALHPKNPQPMAMRRLADYYEERCKYETYWMHDDSFWKRKPQEADSVLRYRTMAAQYTAEDKCRLGVLYAEGWIAPRDDGAAMRLFRQAAQGGCPAGWMRMGMMMEQGLGTPRNIDSAVVCYRQAFNMGDTTGDADYFMGHILLAGLEGKVDRTQALNRFINSANRGSVWGTYGLGEYYEDEPANAEAAESYFKAAADRGHRDAMFKMGEMLMRRLDVFYSGTDAYGYYLKAAVRGHADALLTVGLLDDGTYAVRPRSVDLYRSLANTGDARALYFLGAQYEYGDYHDIDSLNVPQSYDSALHFYRLAAADGNEAAALRLADLYLKGHGTAPDTVAALRYFMQAYSKGYCNDWYLWQLINQWNGSATDSQRIIQLRKRANRTSNADALDSLGLCHLLGDGTRKDLPEAARLFRQAADKGHTDAMCNLAMLLERSELHQADSTWPYDPFEAYRLYDSAAAHGSVRAMHQLGKREWSQTFENHTLCPRPELLRQTAMLGNAASQYLYARSLKQNSERMRYFLAAARQGIDDAQFALGRAAKLNRGPLKHAAEQNNIHCLFVARSYTGDNIVYPNYRRAAHWYQRGLDNASSVWYDVYQMCAVRLHDHYLFYERDEHKAMEILLEAIEKSKRDEYITGELGYAIGMMYEHGLDTVQPDTARACDCYTHMALFDGFAHEREEALKRLHCPEVNQSHGESIQIKWGGATQRAKPIDGQPNTYEVDAYSRLVTLDFTLKSDTALDRSQVEVVDYIAFKGANPNNSTTAHEDGDNNLHVTYTLELNPEGTTEVRIAAYNKGGTSKVFTLRLKPARKKVALVVGTNKYRAKRWPALNSPALDAEAVAAALASDGYLVIPCINAPAKALRDSIARMGAEMTDCQTALFYYSGHGLMLPDSCYGLVSVEGDTVMLQEVMASMQKDDNGRDKMLILDACREGASLSALRGQGPFSIIYAVLDSKRAYDGKKGDMSIFTKSLVEILRPTAKLTFTDLHNGLNYVNNLNPQLVKCQGYNHPVIIEGSNQ